MRHLLQRDGRSSEIDRASQRAYSHYYLHMTINGLFPHGKYRPYMCERLDNRNTTLRSMDEYEFFKRKSSNGGDDNLEKIVFIQ